MKANINHRKNVLFLAFDEFSTLTAVNPPEQLQALEMIKIRLADYPNDHPTQKELIIIDNYTQIALSTITLCVCGAIPISTGIITIHECLQLALSNIIEIKKGQ